MKLVFLDDFNWWCSLQSKKCKKSWKSDYIPFHILIETKHHQSFPKLNHMAVVLKCNLMSRMFPPKTLPKGCRSCTLIWCVRSEPLSVGHRCRRCRQYLALLLNMARVVQGTFYILKTWTHSFGASKSSQQLKCFTMEAIIHHFVCKHTYTWDSIQVVCSSRDLHESTRAI